MPLETHHRLESDEIKTQVESVIADLKKEEEATYIDAIEGLDTWEVAKLILDQYADWMGADGNPNWKSRAEIKPTAQNWYAYTVIVQAALSLLDHYDGKIDADYGTGTKAWVSAISAMMGDTWTWAHQAWPEVFAQMYTMLTDNEPTETHSIWGGIPIEDGDTITQPEDENALPEINWKYWGFDVTTSAGYLHVNRKQGHVIYVPYFQEWTDLSSMEDGTQIAIISDPLQDITIWILKDGEIKEGERLYDNWAKYEWSFSDGVLSWKGKMTSGDGSSYEWSYKNGISDGQWLYIRKNWRKSEWYHFNKYAYGWTTIQSVPKNGVTTVSEWLYIKNRKVALDTITSIEKIEDLLYTMPAKARKSFASGEPDIDKATFDTKTSILTLDIDVPWFDGYGDADQIRIDFKNPRIYDENANDLGIAWLNIKPLIIDQLDQLVDKRDAQAEINTEVAAAK